MSTPYPPQPRRLMRDPSHKLIGGVCSGLAKYLNMDINLVRILTVVISLFTGIPIVLYIIALFVMPEERNEPQPPYVNGPQPGAYDAGYAPQAYGQSAPPAQDVWGPGGAPWEQAPAGAPTNAPAGAAAGFPTPAPEQQSWQQPPAAPAASEPTVYDTAPATDAGAEAAVDEAATDETPADETPAGPEAAEGEGDQKA